MSCVPICIHVAVQFPSIHDNVDSQYRQGPTPRPTRWSVTPYPTSPYPTSDIATEAVPGCSPLLGAPGDVTCNLGTSVEYKLRSPQHMETGSPEKRQFGSSVVFVGNGSSIVAVGSGNGNETEDVHIYRRADNLWEYLTSLEVIEWEASKVNFGASLASNDEGYVAVGAPLLDDPNNNPSGKVYLYMPNDDFTRWMLVARFSASDGTFAPGFGASVAMDGSLIAIGSPDEDDGRGRVYIYENSGPLSSVVPGTLWVEAAKLSPGELAGGAGFGSSVSLFGDAPATLAVGAPGDEGGGSAYVYKRDDFQWVSQKLVPRDLQEGGEFGSEVVISGCSIAVTSPGDLKESTGGTGTVRVYNLDAGIGDYWIHSNIIEPDVNLPGEIFGHCIAMEGNTLLVGISLGGDPWDSSQGLVYHFERIAGSWNMITAVLNEDHAPGDEDDHFGCPLSLSGNRFAVGTRGDKSLEPMGPTSGSAFIFNLCPIEGELVFF